MNSDIAYSAHIADNLAHVSRAMAASQRACAVRGPVLTLYSVLRLRCAASLEHSAASVGATGTGTARSCSGACASVRPQGHATAWHAAPVACRHRISQCTSQSCVHLELLCQVSGRAAIRCWASSSTRAAAPRGGARFRSAAGGGPLHHTAHDREAECRGASAAAAAVEAVNGSDYFSLLGVARSFDIDADAVHEAFRALQKRFHPDALAAAAAAVDDAAGGEGGASSEEIAQARADARAGEQLAKGASARINKAYETLRDPVRRAAYLLQLNGVDALGESAKTSDAALLMEMMEKREALAQVADEAGAQRALEEAESDVELVMSALSAAFKFGELDRAAELTVRLQYYNKLRAEAEAAAVRLSR